jgi:Kef-type K+ transport system membrane component KefB
MPNTSHPVLYVMAIAVAAVLFAQIPSRFRLSAAVLEIGFGLLIGPQVLGFMTSEGLLEWLGVAGLAALFFMSGLDLDLETVRGRPLSLALRGWILSVILAIIAVALLSMFSLVTAPTLVGLALTTTALATVLPVLRDAGDVKSKFGAQVIAAGAVGEFGPTMLMAFVFTQGATEWRRAALMVTFMAIACSAAVIALRAKPPRLVRILSRTIHSSAQLPVRLSVLLLVAFVVLSEDMGFEAVLGAFAAGMVVGLACRGEEGKLLHEKLDALCFGFFVPFFFVTSGMKFDIGSLLGSAAIMLLVPLLLISLLIVRGAPILIYRHELDKRDRFALALFSATTLPMVVALTQIGVETRRMLAGEAAALVAAALLSVLLFPAIAGILRASRPTPQARRIA